MFELFGIIILGWVLNLLLGVFVIGLYVSEDHRLLRKILAWSLLIPFIGVVYCALIIVYIVSVFVFWCISSVVCSLLIPFIGVVYCALIIVYIVSVFVFWISSVVWNFISLIKGELTDL